MPAIPTHPHALQTAPQRTIRLRRLDVGGWAGSGKGRPGPWGEKGWFEGKVGYKGGVRGVYRGCVLCVQLRADLYIP